jgi:hypothetical protein
VRLLVGVERPSPAGVVHDRLGDGSRRRVGVDDGPVRPHEADGAVAFEVDLVAALVDEAVVGTTQKGQVVEPCLAALWSNAPRGGRR